LFSLSVVLLDLFGEDCGGQVSLSGFSNFLHHPLLTNVLRALEGEHVRRLLSISQKEFGLHHVLREVLKNHSGLLLLGEVLD